MRDNTILKLAAKRGLALLLVLFMLFGFMPEVHIDKETGKLGVELVENPLLSKAFAATVASGNGTWISGKLTYTWEATSNGTTGNGATGSVSVSGNTLTVTATNSKEVSGCSTTAAEATTTTVTATNASSYPIKITTLTTGGSASVSGVSQGQTIASGATFKVTVTAPAVSSSTKVSGTVAIAVEEQTSVTITLAPSPYVAYTVNGKTVAQDGSEQSFEVDAGTTISLPTITAPSGYSFKGWRIGSSMTTASSFTANASYTVFPVIVSSSVDITAANFKVGSTTYTFWEDAVTAALSGGGTMFVNLEDVTLPDNVLDNLLPASGGTYVKPVSGGGVEYILPASVTLVLPYSTSTTVHTTAPAYGYTARVAPSPFRTLTVPNGVKITVNGSVSVDSYVCAYGQSNQGNGTPSGPHGKIVMKSGSEMTFNSGANLYCWGYINGDGQIYMNSGAKVYELFQFCDWRGGNGTNNINGNSQRVFPMSQYYVQNVEAPMRIYKGATEYVWSAVNMSSKAYPVSAFEFIGANGMFKLTGSNSDYITKRYHANVDRLEIAAHGDMSLNNLTVKVSGLPLIGTITMNSSEYVLPINNINVVVETGTTSIASSQTYGIEFLPSSKLTVNEGATFTANAPVYFYDAEDWGGYVGASNAKLVVSGYSTANGTTTMRTADNLKDAELDVNGTVNVSNKLYTTPHGAKITSSEGTGVINFTTACATSTATTYQATQSGTDISYVSITVNNAWLQNGDESYSYTVGTGTSTWHYDKPGEHWYRYLVDFQYNGNIIKRDYYCENNDTVTYEAGADFVNLNATATNGVSVAVDNTANTVSVTNVTSDCVVTITGTPGMYVPCFVLNEKQYSIYQMYTGLTLTQTKQIGEETYYVVEQASDEILFGTAYEAPTDEEMGVSAANHNDFVWNLSGISFTSGDPYLGTVPRGESAGSLVYIYGFYDGVIAYNSWNDTYYKTLLGAFEVLPQDVSATITLLADCGTFEEESGTVAFATYPDNNITLDLNGHKAVGRIVNRGTFTLELNGGIFEFHTGATVQAATWKGLAAVINSGTMTIQDSTGGGVVKSDACSSSSGSDGSAVIRNNAGATLTVTGKDADHLLTILENQTEVAYNSSYGYYAYNYGIYNLGTITALTNVDITAVHSRTTGVNVYNYNTGVIDLITGCHMYAYSGASIFNYGGTITTVTGTTIDGKNGITNYNIRGGSQAAGWTVANADKGVIDTITNCHIEVGQYAINNNAVINTISSSMLIAHPDTAQVDTRGDGKDVVSESNSTCAYTVYNSANWWYNTNVWKQVDSSSSPYTRVNYYKEEEQYRPTIGQIIDCEIYAENTTTSASYGDYALVNSGGVINKIGGTTTIKTYKHPDSTASITTSHYAMQNLAGGIIKSIEGTVNISATGIGTVYNTGIFTTQINYTYGNKVGGNVTYQESTYGDPSTILSITCAGTWSCGSYYCILNSGYIQTINAPSLTLKSATSGYNVLYNYMDGANSSLVYRCDYTDSATASTAYYREATYTRNLEKGGTIGTLNGVAIQGKYSVVVNYGHIGTLSNVTVSTLTSSNDVTFLNCDNRVATVTEYRRDVAHYSTDYPNVTISAGYATRYDRDWTYVPATIDVIDNLTVNSTGQYALRNCGVIGTLKNSTLTASTNYALHNSASGPLTEKQSVQYYSGTSVFATTKYTSEYSKHYERDPATINLIDNCTIKTTGGTYAAKNTGHIGTIKDSTFTAGTTTASAYALANIESCEREYTLNLEDYFYVTANAGTACTAYWATNGETKVVTYDYDAPTIDLIGEGNTFTATSPTIANTGVITAINSGEGTPTTITSTAAKGYAIYNYTAVLDARTTTTPYTAAASAGASGTAGSAVNTDTYLSGAQIGTIKNVYIDANGYGIQNGSANASYLPVIGEIGEGTEIYAHCTTAGYAPIYNTTYAKITSITGGLFKATKATTNAYKNNSTDPALATLISGGDFQGAGNTRANAIFEPDITNRQTYPEGKMLSTYTEDPTEVNANMSGTYYFINDVYTVTFDMQGHGTAPESQSIEKTKKATAPTGFTSGTTTVTDEGGTFYFGGWYKEETCDNVWDFDTDTVTEPTTIYAKWTQSFTVTFNVQGHGTAPAALTDISPNSTIDAPDGFTAGTTTVTENGVKYRFDGWYEEGAANAWDFENNTVTADTTLYAKWTALYTVTWKNGSTTLETDSDVPEGTAPSYDGTPPTKEQDAQYDYTFAGWATSDEQESGTAVGSLPNVTANTTYYAAFSKTTRSYTITWQDENGSTIDTTIVDYGTMPTHAAPTKASTVESDYTFAGWTPTVTSVTGDTIYRATFTETPRKYTITWQNEDGSTIDTTSVAYGTTPTHANPTKASTAQHTYTFAGWTPTVTSVTGDATYTATFTESVREYTITWKNDSGSIINTTKVPYGTVPSHADATKASTAQYTYTFAGWTPELTTVTGDATYTATFTPTLRSYDVTFNMKGHGTAPSTQHLDYGSLVSAPDGFTVGTTTVTDSGVKYRFDGWYKETGCTNAWDFSSDTVKGATSIFAKWTALYTVTFNANGYGTAPAALTDIVSGSTITAPTAPTAEGYAFAGWYKEAACTNAWNFDSDTVTKNTILYAKWTCTVSFNMQEHGDQIAPITVIPGNTITAPTAPTADGCAFLGWYKEAECTNEWNFASDVVTADTTLYAKWRVNIRNAVVTVSGTYTYTGSAITPDAANVTVTLNDVTLVYGTDYTFEASSNTNAGTATVTVTGTGTYGGTATGTFTIAPKAVTVFGITAENKTYDGTTDATFVTTAATFTGKIDGDTLTVTATGAFVEKTVGNNKTVNISGLTLGGAKADNYVLAASGNQTTTTANITAKSVTITGLSASNKIYDGNANASVTGTAVVSGKLDGDTVTVTEGGASFDNKNVGTGKTVTFTGYELSGDDAGNYVLSAQPADVTANITAKSVTITGLGASDKTYDGTTTATVTGTATVDGKLDGDTVTVTAGSASFDNKNVGTGKTVTFTGYSLSGADAGNYTLSAQPASTTANITAKSVTITGLGAEDKVYDGNTNAAVTGEATVDGKVDGDDLSVAAGSASFDNKNVGTGKTVTFTGYSLSGSDAGNYTLSAQPASVTASITAKALTITGLGAESKTYDGTTNATVTGTATLIGVVGEENVSLTSGSASFADADVGTGKTVAFTGYALEGTDAGNYSLTQPASVTADITRAALTVTAKPNTITYGDAPTNDGVTYSGFVTGEDESVLGGTLAYAYNYEQFGDVGDYTITPGGLKSSNYDISFVAGTLTVEKKTLTITWSTDPIYYDNTEQAPTASVSGMVNNDEIGVTVGGAASAAGDYIATATLTGAKAGNYLPDPGTFEFTIIQTYTVIWKNGETTLKTDEYVHPGVTPEYTGTTTPTQDGSGIISYLHSGWKTADGAEIAPAAADVTYIAQFDTIYSIKLDYTTQVEENGTTTTIKDYTNTGVTIKYNDGKVEVSEPSIRYYNLNYWTINNSGSYDTDELASTLKTMVESGDLDSTTTVKAFFLRQSVQVKIYSITNGGKLTDQHYEFTAYAGRSFYVNSSATVDGVPFSYWKIGPASEYPDGFAGIAQVPERKTSYFVGENPTENNPTGEIMAIAYFTSEGQGTTDVHPKVSIADYWTEGTAGSYRLGMTVSVIAPPDTTNFEVLKVGFGKADQAAFDKREFSEVECSGWNGWTSGTYTRRYSVATKAYTYAYIIYRLNDVTYRIFATSTSQSDPVVDSGYPYLNGESMPKTEIWDTWTEPGD